MEQEDELTQKERFIEMAVMFVAVALVLFSYLKILFF